MTKLIGPLGNVCCPICNSWFPGSFYLSTVFSEPRQLWLANMVTHYRHEHVSYYDRWVGFQSIFYGYQRFKRLVNNRAKRQILRKCKQFLTDHGFRCEDFAALQGTDQKTLDLAFKILGGNRIVIPRPVKNDAQLSLDEFMEEHL